MQNRLPPLNALRAFEVAARHLSFAAAARELHVTNAAISHQIKSLEEALGVQLFMRQNNHILLTVAGETYLPKVREAFRTLRESTHQLLGIHSVTLRLAVRSAFCLMWLLPRLPRFYEAYPGIHLDIENEVDRNYLQYDLTIDYRPTGVPDYSVQQLLSTPLYPVCSPQWREQLQQPEDLMRVPVLHDRPLQGMPEYPDWQRWLAAAGCPTNLNPQGVTFATALMCQQAAIAGLGVALGQHVLVEGELESGRLVRALPELQAPIHLPYYLISPVTADENPGMAPFMSWLTAEAARGQAGAWA